MVAFVLIGPEPSVVKISLLDYQFGVAPAMRILVDLFEDGYAVLPWCWLSQRYSASRSHIHTSHLVDGEADVSSETQTWDHSSGWIIDAQPEEDRNGCAPGLYEISPMNEGAAFFHFDRTRRVKSASAEVIVSEIDEAVARQRLREFAGEKYWEIAESSGSSLRYV